MRMSLSRVFRGWVGTQYWFPMWGPALGVRLAKVLMKVCLPRLQDCVDKLARGEEGGVPPGDVLFLKASEASSTRGSLYKACVALPSLLEGSRIVERDLRCLRLNCGRKFPHIKKAFFRLHIPRFFSPAPGTTGY